MSWWNAITSVVEDAGNEFVSEVETGLTNTSHALNQVSDTLENIDEAIEAVPVVGTLYDLTPAHTALHLGSEWAGVGGELAGDLDNSLEGRQSDWGHLGNQALAAGVDTAITIAASEIGGAGAGKILGKVGGSAGRLGMKTVGRDVAGDLGAKGAGSFSRRAVDWVAHTGLQGTIGGAISAPANASAHGAGIGWDDRPHLQRQRGENAPPSSGRLGQGGSGGNMSMRGARNHTHQQVSGNMSNMDYVRNHASNRPVDNMIPHHSYTPPYQVSYKQQMNMAKQRNEGIDVRPPPSNSFYEPKPYDAVNPNYSVNTNPRYQPQPVENPVR